MKVVDEISAVDRDNRDKPHEDITIDRIDVG